MSLSGNDGRPGGNDDLDVRGNEVFLCLVPVRPQHQPSDRHSLPSLLQSPDGKDQRSVGPSSPAASSQLEPAPSFQDGVGDCFERGLSGYDVREPADASREGDWKEGEIDLLERRESVDREEGSEGGFGMEVGESNSLDRRVAEGEELEEVREEGSADDGGVVSGELGGEFGNDEVGGSRRENHSGGEVESRSLLK